MQYRAEIDGLRAIAVIPVIFFHAGSMWFRGGYVGVDVFFVISGYLITTILLTEMEENGFSLINFYERRARRILPALFLVMLISFVGAWLIFQPQDMKDFAESLVAVSLFSSNFLFWHETNYWDTASEFKPLLHTWSLAVEEQYYILFPLFLMALWHWRKRWIFGAFLLVSLASLALAQWDAYHHPARNFYLLPSRGWELAIGALIAFLFIYRREMMQTLVTKRVSEESFGLLGLVMIAYSVFMFDEHTPHPSLYTLLPTIGAGLIITFVSSATFAGRLLGSKVLVGTGVISYSAYLWHQPLFAFARHLSFPEANQILLFCLAFITFPLAFASWKYIEKPFRQKTRINRKKNFCFLSCRISIFYHYRIVGILE